VDIIELFSVFARIGANTSEFEQGIAQAEGRGKGFAAGMGKAVAAGAAVIGTALVAVGSAAIAVGTDYDSAMNKIQSRTGMTGDDVEKLGMAFRDMGLDGVFSAQEIANAYSYVAVTGQDATHAIGIMESAMTMAQATGNDLGSTAYFLGNYLLKVGKDASYADKYINLFTQGIANTGISLNDMQNYMFRMTPAFEQFGASSETNVAIMTRLYQAGIRGAALYSGMGTIMMEFGTNSEMTAEMLSRFNVSMTHANGTAKTNEELMFEVAQAMSEYSDQTAMAQFVTENMNQAQQQAWFEFMNLAQEIQNEVIPSFYDATSALGEYGIAAQMAENNTLSFNQSMGMIQNSGADMLKTLWGIIETPVSNVLATAAETMRDLAMRMREGGDLHPVMQRLGEVIARLAEIIINLASRAVPPLVRILSVLGGALVGVIDMVVRFAPAIMAVVGAITAWKAGMAITAQIADFKKVLVAKKAVLAQYAASIGLTSTKMKGMGIATQAWAAVKGILTGKIALATVAQKALNLAMKANPIGLIIAAVALLVTGIIALVNAMNRESDAARQLRQDTEALRAETDRLSDSMQNSANAHSERMSGLNANAGAARNLVDRIEELNSVENKSAEQRQRLATYVDMLNDKMGETVAVINEETGALETNVSTIRERIDALAEEARAAALRERATEITMEQIRAEEQLAAVQAARADAREQGLDVQMRWNALRQEYVPVLNSTSAAYVDLIQQEEYWAASLEGHAESLERVLNMAVYGYDAMSEAATEYGQHLIQTHDLINYSRQHAANVAQEAEAEIREAYYETLQAIGESAERQAEVLQLLGEEYQRIASKATDAFREMSTETEHTLGEMSQTLYNNAQATIEWGNNVVDVTERLRAQGFEENVVQAMVDMANECPAIAALMSNDVVGELYDMAENMGLAMDAGVTNVATRLGANEEVVSAAADLATSAHESLYNKIQEVGFDDAGVAAVQALAQGISDEAITAELASRDLGQDTIDALKSIFRMRSPPREFVEIGEAVPDALGTGITKKVFMAVKAGMLLARDVVDEICSTLTNANFNSMGANVAQGLADGINANAWRAINAAQALANAVANTMRNALQIFSPSRVFEKFGEQTGEGYAIGILNKVARAKAAVSELINIPATNVNVGGVAGMHSREAVVGGRGGIIEKLVININNEMDLEYVLGRVDEYLKTGYLGALRSRGVAYG